MGKRVYYLDFIRAISICLIIIFHFNVHTLEMAVSDSPVFWKISVVAHSLLGKLGVSLFIILSGASLMLSTKENFNIRVFFKNRFFSIYPLFWTTYLTTFITLFLIHNRFPAKAHPLSFFLTIIGLDGFLIYAIPNFYLLGEWFLGFIIIMYIIYPLLRFLYIKNAILTIIVCVVITLITGIFVHLKMPIMRFPLFRLAEFVVGMSFIYYSVPHSQLVKSILILVAGSIFFLAFRLDIPAPFTLIIQGMTLFICLACMSDFFKNLLIAAPIRFISEYSYGAFLIHHVVFYQILPLYKNQHLSMSKDYLLFFVLFIFIYTLSFLLTNAVTFGLRKISINKLVLSPVFRK